VIVYPSGSESGVEEEGEDKEPEEIPQRTKQDLRIDPCNSYGNERTDEPGQVNRREMKMISNEMDFVRGSSLKRNVCPFILLKRISIIRSQVS
jgi:hypothetical protein